MCLFYPLIFELSNILAVYRMLIKQLLFSFPFNDMDEKTFANMILILLQRSFSPTLSKRFLDFLFFFGGPFILQYFWMWSFYMSPALYPVVLFNLTHVFLKQNMYLSLFVDSFYLSSAFFSSRTPLRTSYFQSFFNVSIFAI